MSMSIEEVTADTPCPYQYGGETYHFPLARNGKPVTQPGPDTQYGGRPKPVMLALCFSARRAVYLVPPRKKPDPGRPPKLCPACAHARAEELARSPGQLVAAAC
jgi:hypothetical protein